MKKAWKNVNNIKQIYSKSKSTTELSTTHYYIKFIPKNSYELGIIEKDSSLIAYDYPLDYEILQMGDYYHDPEVPIEQPTYHYASVEIGKPLPRDIEYEILSDLFIPDIEDIGEELYDSLIDEALRLINNLEAETTEKGLFSRRSKWRPAGTIKVWDANIGQTSTTTRVFSHWEYYDCGNNGGDEIQPRIEERLIPIEDTRCRRAVYRYVTTTTNGSYVPVEGVKVRARRWFTTYTGITNAQGYYSCNGRLRRPANYKIKWKRHEFAIRWSALSSAKYNGPKKKGDWNLNIRGGTQEYYATIFRASHHYYCKDIKGLRRPPQNSFWRTQLKIRAFKQYINDDGDAIGTHNSGWRFFGLHSPVKIYTFERPAIETYTTVIHELAHASHWNMNRSSFRDIPDSEARVKESWARGFEWELSRMVYPNYRGGSTFRPRYTQVVIDMIDPNYSSPFNNLNRGLWNDKVTSYTIRQIEDAIDNQRSWIN